MTDRIRDPIPLSQQQVEALRTATRNNTGNYPAGYALVHDWIKDNPAAKADGTVFWFEQARGINQNDSLSARFIRRHTENGLNLGNVPLDKRLPMQELSNRIARRVTEDLLEQNKVLPRHKLSTGIFRSHSETDMFHSVAGAAASTSTICHSSLKAARISPGNPVANITASATRSRGGVNVSCC